MDIVAKYLDPRVVSQLATMELRARLIVEGFLTGFHRSPFHGFSAEFSEHRSYHPGDDLRYLDWKVLGRTDRYYVKQFEEETNLRAVIALDQSASMRYASDGSIAKFTYGTYLAAALAYLAMLQKDAVGVALYDETLRAYYPPRARRSYLGELLATLDRAQPSNATNTAHSLELLAERLHRRSLVIVISDFFDDLDRIATSLKHFRHDRHEVIAIHVLDRRELDFRFGLAATFRDMETGQEMITQPLQVQRAYTEAVSGFIEQLKAICYRANIDYVQAVTDQPFDRLLQEYLVRRQRVR
ncbi:MAG: DUF58 domain-containing protein [Bacteroidota bacterium]|nr:DUF58 domain-containing protein [Candidatus Kapabacteria bacterium]MDW8074189.1 DUF58 domain-containing protein [Bacteroidota bacterium]MDW8271335.1 DUF58 domain-containing protein [Bacteroidota bacterium]